MASFFIEQKPKIQFSEFIYIHQFTLTRSLYSSQHSSFQIYSLTNSKLYSYTTIETRSTFTFTTDTFLQSWFCSACSMLQFSSSLNLIQITDSVEVLLQISVPELFVQISGSEVLVRFQVLKCLFRFKVLKCLFRFQVLKCLFRFQVLKCLFRFQVLQCLFRFQVLQCLSRFQVFLHAKNSSQFTMGAIKSMNLTSRFIILRTNYLLFVISHQK